MSLYHLLSETIRLNTLRRLMPEITQRMPTKQLSQIFSHGADS
ncbi:winged helix-turn-helix transcriptional regulator [Leptothoe sp. PORK10 BA2]